MHKYPSGPFLLFLCKEYYQLIYFSVLKIDHQINQIIPNRLMGQIALFIIFEFLQLINLEEIIVIRGWLETFIIEILIIRLGCLIILGNCCTQ